MNQALETQLIKACIENKAQRTTTQGSGEHKADTDRYRNQDTFEQEMEKVFKQLPSILLHASELEGPDSYKTVDSPLGALIVTRDAQGKAIFFTIAADIVAPSWSTAVAATNA